MEDFQVREEHWVIADLIGKGKHIRTVPVPVWAKRAVDESTGAAKIDQGAIFRADIKIWLHMTCAAPARGYATWLAVNLNKFSSCLGTHRFRRPSTISDASRSCDTR